MWGHYWRKPVGVPYGAIVPIAVMAVRQIALNGVPRKCGDARACQRGGVKRGDARGRRMRSQRPRLQVPAGTASRAAPAIQAWVISPAPRITDCFACDMVSSVFEDTASHARAKTKMPPGLAASRCRYTYGNGPPRLGAPPAIQSQRGRVRFHENSIAQQRDGSSIAGPPMRSSSAVPLHAPAAPAFKMARG